MGCTESEHIRAWETYFLNALIVPNPGSMQNVEESKMITEADKRRCYGL
jgi:hypothetical protein